MTVLSALFPFSPALAHTTSFRQPEAFSYTHTHTRIALSVPDLIVFQIKGVKDNFKSTVVTDNPAGVPCAYVSSSVFLGVPPCVCLCLCLCTVPVCSKVDPCLPTRTL